MYIPVVLCVEPRGKKGRKAGETNRKRKIKNHQQLVVCAGIESRATDNLGFWHDVVDRVDPCCCCTHVLAKQCDRISGLLMM